MQTRRRLIRLSSVAAKPDRSTCFAFAALARHNGNMATELNDQEKVILAEPLREEIAASRFPLSPCMRSPKGDRREAGVGAYRRAVSAAQAISRAERRAGPLYWCSQARHAYK